MSATATASTITPPPPTSAITAPTQLVGANGVTYAYRRFGGGRALPLLCLQHFTGTLDNWDPAVTDPLAAGREVILFDNASGLDWLSRRGSSKHMAGAFGSKARSVWAARSHSPFRRASRQPCDRRATTATPKCNRP